MTSERWVRPRRWAARALAAAALAGCSTEDVCDEAACQAVAAQLVFNEMAGTGADFVELYNAGTADVDVSGYGLSDSESNGAPRVTHAFRFPAGTAVRPGAYLVVMMESNCPAGATGFTCFRAEFGLSQGGETVHLLNPSNREVAAMAYPANAAPSGRSWGRVPNGSGAFQVTSRTPGAANAP